MIDSPFRACRRDLGTRIIGAMILAPSSLKDLTRGLAHAFALGEKVEKVQWAALNRVLQHTPEDMTVTVEAGITLAMLQAELSKRGQWLPIDPPDPQDLTIEALLATNASGPRRFGYGTIRDYVLGIKVAMADGRVVKSGGQVVKNVAGYDLCKLFVGSRGSLGVIAEATFKLRPVPEVEQIVSLECESLEKAARLMDTLLESDLTPVILDLHNQPSRITNHGSRVTLVLGFAGTREEVEWQLGQAGGLGFQEPSNLDHEKRFWADESPTNRLSVLPAKTIEAVRRLGDAPFVARAGNGVIYYRGGAAPPKNDAPIKLTRRLKEAFDPKHILPDLSW